jgi:hypothetical protein
MVLAMVDNMIFFVPLGKEPEFGTIIVYLEDNLTYCKKIVCLTADAKTSSVADQKGLSCGDTLRHLLGSKTLISVD